MSYRRWLALCGVAAALLVPLGVFVVGGSTPDDKASGDEVVSFYRDHLAANRVAALMVVIGAALLVLFGVRLRELLDGDGPGANSFSLAAFGGAVLTSAGLLHAAAGHFALVDASDHQFAASAQTLNVLDTRSFFGIVGGFAVLFLAAGIATVRHPVLPRWLGWAAIVIGVLSVAGPIGGLGFVLGLVWLLVVGIITFLRADDIPATVVVEIAIEP